MSPIENNIVRPQPSDTPETLYKYRYFDDNEYHIRLVSNSELWFTSAREFNDPFDSSLPYRFEDDPPGIQMRWIIHAIENIFPGTPPDLIKVKAKQKYEEIHADPDYFERFSQKYVEYNFNKFGICTLTPKPNNLLMWAHYAKNHEGFCVGIDSGILYDIQQNLAKQHKPVILLKIKYSKTMPEINFFQSMLSNDLNRNILQLLTSKSTHWEYEDEYRLILYDHVNTTLDIGHDAINKIILGCEISDINKDKILRIVRELDCNIPVFQSRKGQLKYEVKFEMIDL